MKKFFLLSTLALCINLLSAQNYNCGLIENGSFEDFSCTNSNNYLFGDGCAGTSWDCYFDLPTFQGGPGQNNLWGAAADGEIYGYMKGDKNQAIRYTDLNGEIEYGGVYDISFQVKALVRQNTEPADADPVIYDLYVYDSEFAEAYCQSWPIQNISLPFGAQLISSGELEPGQDWIEITEEDVVINPVTDNQNPISFLVVASANAGDNEARLGFDDFCIDVAPCDVIECKEDSNLITCEETNSMGYVHVDCPNALGFEWNLGGNNTAVVFSNSTGTALVNAGPGTYTLTILGENNCTEERVYEIVESCCDDGSCGVPENLLCTYTFGNLGLNWADVPNALQYEITIIPGDVDCPCFSPTGDPVNPFKVYRLQSSYTVPAGAEWASCFSWQVRATCDGDNYGDPSVKKCQTPQTECIGFGFKMEEQNGKTPQQIKPSVYPNPTQTDLYFEMELAKGGNLDIRLIDLQGKELRTFSFERLNAGLFKTDLGIQGLPAAGMYILQTKTDSEQFEERIVIVE